MTLDALGQELEAFIHQPMRSEDVGHGKKRAPRLVLLETLRDLALGTREGKIRQDGEPRSLHSRTIPTSRRRVRRGFIIRDRTIRVVDLVHTVGLRAACLNGSRDLVVLTGKTDG